MRNRGRTARLFNDRYQRARDRWPSDLFALLFLRVVPRQQWGCVPAAITSRWNSSPDAGKLYATPSARRRSTCRTVLADSRNPPPQPRAVCAARSRAAPEPEAAEDRHSLRGPRGLDPRRQVPSLVPGTVGPASRERVFPCAGQDRRRPRRGRSASSTRDRKRSPRRTELGKPLAGRRREINTRSARWLRQPGLQRVLAVLAAPSTNLARLVSAAAAATTTSARSRSNCLPAGQWGDDVRRRERRATRWGERSVRAPGAVSRRRRRSYIWPGLVAAARSARALHRRRKIIPQTFRNLDADARVHPGRRRGRTLAPPLKTAFRAVNGFAANRNAINALHVLRNDLATFGASGFVGLGRSSRRCTAQLTCNLAGL